MDVEARMSVYFMETEDPQPMAFDLFVHLPGSLKTSPYLNTHPDFVAGAALCGP